MKYEMLGQAYKAIGVPGPELGAETFAIVGKWPSIIFIYVWYLKLNPATHNSFLKSLAESDFLQLAR